MFIDYESLSGLKSPHHVISNEGPKDETDYGNIDALNKEGQNFQLYGDFGNVNIHGGIIDLKIDNADG